MVSDPDPIGGSQQPSANSARCQVPLRTIAVHVNEGDDPDLLRSAFGLGANEMFFGLEDHVPGPKLATAQGIRLTYEIATASPRVGYVGGCLDQHGDTARSIKYELTRDMDESLSIRQKVLFDARAAGVPYPVSGVWNPAADLEEQNFAVRSRNIGCSGLLVLPLPEHAALMNSAFTPTQDGVDYWAKIVSLMESVDTDDLMPDLVVGGQVIPENQLLWGRLRLDSAAEFGVLQSRNRQKLVADHIGSASAHWRDLAAVGRDGDETRR